MGLCYLPSDELNTLKGRNVIIELLYIVVDIVCDIMLYFFEILALELK